MKTVVFAVLGAALVAVLGSAFALPVLDQRLASDRARVEQAQCEREIDAAIESGDYIPITDDGPGWCDNELWKELR